MVLVTQLRDSELGACVGCNTNSDDDKSLKKITFGTHKGYYQQICLCEKCLNSLVKKINPSALCVEEYHSALKEYAMIDNVTRKKICGSTSINNILEINPPEFVDKLNTYREGLPKIGEVWAHDDDNSDCVVIYRTSDSNVYYYYMSGSSSFGAIEEFKKHYHNTGEFISEVVSLKEKLKQLGCKNGTN